MQDGDSMLRCLWCVDSVDLALSVRRLLDVRRDVAKALGVSAVESAERGDYHAASGRQVEWHSLVEHAKACKLSLRPDDPLPTNERNAFAETIIQVCNETTLQAGKRLVDRGLRPLALNLANGIHAGGGFLNGARAQEETLCCSSSLYTTLQGDPMYNFHRGRPGPDSSDWMILSPEAPVFRGVAGTALDEPWLLDFLTSAAPYAPAVGQPRSGDLLERRIHRVLAVASAYGYATLVLGAWGCGAFGNDVERTARDFRNALEDEFRGRFSEIVFAITDWSSERRFLGPFRDVFHPEGDHLLQGTNFDEASPSTDRRVIVRDSGLQRFAAAQLREYDVALAELRGGRKRTHWMWYVLPQLRGLGSSRMSHDYGIASLDEARAYLEHPVLGERLRQCVDAILQHADKPIADVLGGVDALKYRSCLTLFHRAGGLAPLFEASLQVFYGGRECSLTLELLGEA